MSGRPIRLRAGADDIEVIERGDGTVTIGTVPFHVRPAGAARWHVISGDAQMLVHVVWDGSICWAHAAGHVWRLEPAERSRTTRPAEDDDLALASPMPASVRTIHVGAGQAVQRGDVLLVLEAMKMELPIRAPRDGIVAAVRCSAGDLVQPGARLVVLE